jgi:two-component system LytT family sensor kinase
LEQHFITLLVRIGVVASLASLFVRFKSLRQLLVQEDRTLGQRMQLALWFCAMFGTGVFLRIRVKSYNAADLGLEGSLLAGLLGGYVTGMTAGLLISLPALLHGEFPTFPFYAGVGLLGGMLRDFASNSKDDIWRASPLLDLRLVQALRHGQNLAQPFFNLTLLVSIVTAEFLREAVARGFRSTHMFSLYPAEEDWTWWSVLAVYASVYFCVTLPIKVWNATRNEIKLEEQNRLLIEARLQALTSQINPHFLFNTLNSVSSLIRIDPHRARQMILKLSNILRRLLRKHDSMARLRDELEFIDDYLAIELVRFGDKLRFESDIDPSTLDMFIPSMLLQPLVENSVKHGLSSKVEGGTIRIETRVAGGRLHLRIEDDGVGIPEHKLARMLDSGIGVSNVRERLRVLFGSNYRMWIDSQPGGGTRIAIEFPETLVAQVS